MESSLMKFRSQVDAAFKTFKILSSREKFQAKSMIVSLLNEIQSVIDSVVVISVNEIINNVQVKRETDRIVDAVNRSESNDKTKVDVAKLNVNLSNASNSQCSLKGQSSDDLRVNCNVKTNRQASDGTLIRQSCSSVCVETKNNFKSTINNPKIPLTEHEANQLKVSVVDNKDKIRQPTSDVALSVRDDDKISSKDRVIDESCTTKSCETLKRNPETSTSPVLSEVSKENKDPDTENSNSKPQDNHKIPYCSRPPNITQQNKDVRKETESVIANGMSLRPKKRSFISKKSKQTLTEQCLLCDLCVLKFETRNDLVKHLYDVHKVLNVFCKLCQVHFSLEKYVAHSCCYRTDKSKEAAKQVPMKCKTCDQMFVDRRELVRHVKAQHREARQSGLDCKVCGTKFSMYSMLLSHFKQHHVHCRACGRTFANKDDYFEHNQNCPGKMRWKCPKCGETFAKKLYYTKHMIGHELYTCNLCDSSFSHKNKFKRHQKMVHKIRFAEKMHTCDICDKKFMRPSYLDVHRRIHTGEKPVECRHCNKRFRGNRPLLRHLKMQCESNLQNDASDDQKDFLCAECGSCFKKLAYLNRHMKAVHSDEKHQCPHCNLRFKSKIYMLSHARRHKKIKQLICELCGDSFSQNCHLKEHIKFKHSEERNYHCNKCDRSFKNVSSLKRHTLMHEDRRPYVCETCNKSYKTLTHLKRHKSMDHKKAKQTCQDRKLSVQNDEKKKESRGEETRHVNEVSTVVSSSQSLVVGNSAQNVSNNCRSQQPIPDKNVKIPGVFKQKFTEISNDATSSPLTNLTPVQNASSSFSLLSSIQNYDRNNDILPGVCMVADKSVDMIGSYNHIDSYNHDLNDYLHNGNYMKPEMTTITNCINMDVQEPNHIDAMATIHNDHTSFANTNISDGSQFSGFIGPDTTHNNTSSIFLENYLAPLQTSSDEAYPNQANFNPNCEEAHHCNNMADLSILPGEPNYNDISALQAISINMTENEGFQAPDIHQTHYSHDSICNSLQNNIQCPDQFTYHQNM